MLCSKLRRRGVWILELILLTIVSLSDASCQSRKPIDLSVPYWIGEEVEVLNLPLGSWSRDQGYTDLRLSKHSWDREGNYDFLLTNKDGNIKYDVLVGKRLIVKKVSPDENEFLIQFYCTELDISLFATTDKGRVGEVGFVKELKLARDKWLGKTIYSRMKSINTKTAGKGDPFVVDIRTPLKVYKVSFGSDFRPIRLDVETPSGRKGYLEVHYSWTNCYRYWQWFKYDRPYNEMILDSHLLDGFDWDDDMWGLVNSNLIRKGMTRDQVYLSLGMPEKIITSRMGGKTNYQWKYEWKAFLLTFTNNVVTNIEKL